MKLIPGFYLEPPDQNQMKNLVTKLDIPGIETLNPLFSAHSANIWFTDVVSI